MAQVMPTVVVRFIVQMFPWAAGTQSQRLTLDNRAAASALVDLVEHIPAELMPSDRVSYAELLCGLAAIRTAVATWSSGGSAPLDSIPGVGHGISPVTLIFSALNGLPDEPAEASPAYLSPALSQAFDFLDAVWRLKFGREHKLLRVQLLTPISDLERDCSTREEFQSRLSALADTLKLIRVDDRLLADHPEKDEIKPEQSFRRLQAALSNILAPESLDRVKDTTEQLAAINRLRVAAQHSDSKTSANRAASLKILRIADYPDASWKEMWDQVRSRAATALGTIATELSAAT